MAASERVFKLIDTAPIIVSPAHPIAGNGSGSIEFRNVWFTYQSLTDEQTHHLKSVILSEAQRAESKDLRFVTEQLTTGPLANVEWILRGVSFTIAPGETAAIVGHTGAGKTTIISLMMRFYDIQHGSILIDGVDIRDQDLTALRRRFGVVLQDPFLFTGTIADNIRLGSSWITDESTRETPPKRSTSPTSSAPSPAVSASPSANAAPLFPPARSSSSASPARSPTHPPSSSSTKPPAPSIPIPSTASASLSPA